MNTHSKRLRRSFLTIILIFVAGVVGAESPAGPAAAGTPSRPRVALVLSGGSAFGMAHVGVIKVLEEAGIPIDMVMGTSMGSIVSGLYAAGYSPEQMKNIVTNIDWNAVFMDRKASADDRYEFQKRTGYAGRVGFGADGLAIGEGLFEGQNVLALFTQLTLHNLTIRNFDDLPVPYRAVAADIWSGDKIVFSKGSLAEAMRSSMSIPGVFKPYVLDGRHIVDGGIVDNLPTDIAKELGADIIIAVESRGSEPKGPESLNNALAITGQTAGLFIQQNMKPSRKLADILIVPDLSAYTTASYGEAAGIIAQGEAGARAMLPQLKAIADRIAASRPLISPEKQPNRAAFHDLLPFSSLKIEGGTAQDKELARAAFSGLVGATPTREAVRAAIDAVYGSGRFDLVKIDLEPAAGGTAGLIVYLTPTFNPGNSILVNFDLDAIVSTTSSIASEISAGLMFRGLTNKDSALFVNTSLGSGFRGYTEFFQPMGPLFVMPWARYAFEIDEYSVPDLLLSISSIYRHYGGGLWAGTTLGQHADFRIGASIESVLDAAKIPKEEKRQVALRGAFRIDTRSNTVFPESGISLLAYGVWSDPLIQSQFTFAQADLDFEAAIPLGPASTLGVAAFAGTDFSGFIPGTEPVDGTRFYSLVRQGMFYGLTSSQQVAVGNSVAGLGLEMRRKLGQINPILGGNVFLLANASVGTANQVSDSEFGFLPLRISGTLGAGLKLTGELGIMGGIGFAGTTAAIRPAITVMIGSFEERLEDLR